MRWSKIAPLPDPEGFASPFAGVRRGPLLLWRAGAECPEGKNGRNRFEKVSTSRVFVLEKPDGAWLAEFRLPHEARLPDLG
jgi:hypothetical protein